MRDISFGASFNRAFAMDHKQLYAERICSIIGHTVLTELWSTLKCTLATH